MDPNEDALLVEHDFTDALSPNVEGMDLKQLKKANSSNKISNYPPLIVLLLTSIIVILGLSIGSLLIMICQFGNVVEEITKMKGETREMHEQIKEISKYIKLDPIENGWSLLDHGSKLNISENQLVATLTDGIGWNSARTRLPIPKINFGEYKPPIQFYFEVEFLNKKGNIFIGFGTKQFPLEGNWLGELDNSIGIWRKNTIWIEGAETIFGNVQEYFKQGDVVGLGLIHSPGVSSMECFVTLNGQLLRRVNLWSSFATLQLYPAISMHYGGDSVRANFGKEQFRFNVSAEVLQ